MILLYIFSSSLYLTLSSSLLEAHTTVVHALMSFFATATAKQQSLEKQLWVALVDHVHICSQVGISDIWLSGLVGRSCASRAAEGLYTVSSDQDALFSIAILQDPIL